MTPDEVVSLWIEECRRGPVNSLRLADIATIRTGGKKA